MHLKPRLSTAPSDEPAREHVRPPLLLRVVRIVESVRRNLYAEERHVTQVRDGSVVRVGREPNGREQLRKLRCRQDRRASGKLNEGLVDSLSKREILNLDRVERELRIDLLGFGDVLCLYTRTLAAPSATSFVAYSSEGSALRHGHSLDDVLRGLVEETTRA